MSRKNRNARSVNPQVTPTKQIHVKLGEMDNTTIRMLDEKCGFEFRTLSSTLIETDTSYQRDIDKERVKKIVENFDPRVVNPLKVSFRDGHYYVFDGAHTLAALKKVHKFDNFPVVCMIFHGLSLGDEAYLFALQSGFSKSVASAYRIKALVTSGDTAAIDFIKRIEDAGFRIAYKGSSAPNAFACVDKLWSKYNEDPETFSETLVLLRECWHGDHWSLVGNVFGGVFVFLKTYKKKYNITQFVKNLGKIGDTTIIEKKMSNNGTKDSKYAFAMVQLYNRGSRKNLLNPYLLYDMAS